MKVMFLSFGISIIFGLIAETWVAVNGLFDTFNAWLPVLIMAGSFLLVYPVLRQKA